MKSYYDDQKIAAEKRINIIKGQIEALSKAINNDKYCIDLLNQSLAIQNSLKSLDTLLLERHLKVHVPHQLHKEPAKAVKEIVELFKRRK